jgi:putative FmdB family regulatory protein
MPFYEYECTNCKFYVEALQKISDKPLKECPSCKKQTLQKLLSAPVFRLKGAGWYETDFKSDKEEKRNLAGREEATEAKSEEAKTDSAKEKDKQAAKPAETKPAAERKAKVGKSATAVTSKTKPKVAAKSAGKAKAKAKPAAKKKGRR